MYLSWSPWSTSVFTNPINRFLFHLLFLSAVLLESRLILVDVIFLKPGDTHSQQMFNWGASYVVASPRRYSLFGIRPSSLHITVTSVNSEDNNTQLGQTNYGTLSRQISVLVFLLLPHISSSASVSHYWFIPVLVALLMAPWSTVIKVLGKFPH